MAKQMRKLVVVGGFVLGVVTLHTCGGDDPPSAPGRADVPAPVPAPSAAVAAPAPVVLVGAGNTASCSSKRDDETAALLNDIDGTVVTLGDNAYPSGTVAQYTDCYDPTWGLHKARTRPVPGERDYGTAGAAGYFGYFGAAAGDPAKGYYSFDLGAWHVVVLNSEISTSATSAQVAWLRADLAANGKACTLAMWHKPRFSSAKDQVNEFEALWDALYEAGAEVILNAHYMVYERLAPQRTDGTTDPVNGIRQFTVGTGGSGRSPWKTVRPNSEARSNLTYGVLKLTLRETGYDWEFVAIPGWPFSDSGSADCTGATPPPDTGATGPIAAPGAGYTGDEGSPVTFDGSASTDPGGNTPLTYAWSFGDGHTSAGVSPSHTYAASGTYTVSLTVTNSVGTASEPATTTATIANVAPTVDAGPDRSLTVGGTLNLSASYTDPAPGDGPWSYVIAWGDGATSSGTSTSPSTSITGSHAYPTAGTYTVRVSVTDKDGGTGTDDARLTVGAASGSQTLITVGDIADCSTTRDERVANLLDTIPGPILTIGDNVYEDATAADYANCFEPSWGRHKARMYVNLGNHEYYSGTANPTWDYFGSRAGPRGKGYHSFDVGDWHIVVINDNADFVSYARGSEQEQWLRADLAANTKLCTIAVWHHPYFFSSNSSTTRNSEQRILMDILYEAGVDILLNGHRHYYERFAKQDPLANRDDARGVREFMVGTGGRSYSTWTKVAPNSEVRATKTYGVLKLTLHADRYDWKFIAIDGQTFTDSGSTACH